MSPVSAIALSGMNAAMLRLSASARNIANVRSNGPLPGAAQAGDYPPAFTPVDVVQISRLGGGVEAYIVDSPVPPVAVYDPSAPYADANGFVAAPDIDLGEQVVGLLTARNEYAANLMVLLVEADMMDRLLDIKA